MHPEAPQKPPTRSQRPADEAHGGEVILRHTGVTAVIPCHEGHDAVDPLIEQLARSERRLGLWASPIRLRAIVVDNGCEVPLEPDKLDRPLDQLPVSVIRIPKNVGGSGGFNRGISRALLENPYNLIWLLDSDTRITPLTLALLVHRMEQERDLVALGPALADQASSTDEPIVHEIGGRINPKTGDLGPARRKRPGNTDRLVRCDYVASCCAMIRPDAIRDTGLMPDTFLSGDDAGWMLRMQRETGGRIGADPAVTAFHPRFDRFATTARYYKARNAFLPIEAAGLGPKIRRRRAMTETRRAVNQALLGRMDLASLHLLGLRDAWAGWTEGRCAHRVGVHRAEPIETLPTHLGLTASKARTRVSVIGNAHSDRGAYLAACGRFLLGSGKKRDAVPAKGGPAAWFRAKKVALVAEETFVVRPLARLQRVSDALDAYVIGRKYARRLKRAAPAYPEPTPAPTVTRAQRLLERPRGALLSIVVLTHNREQRLTDTLLELSGVLGRDLTLDATPDDEHEVIVVMNDCTDGTRAALESRFHGVRTIELDRNRGVGGFNIGVREAVGEYVLILDDDAWPDAAGLDAAMDLLESDRTVGAVALHPVHPATGVSEWPFEIPAGYVRKKWPVMGSGNLVRRRDWLSARGYERRYHVYRNDTDLALKLLGMGRDVAFNPSWLVWHDSPAAAHKPAHWHRLALRNWVWTGRRHAGRLGSAWGVLLAWLWAHKAAGWSLPKHAATLRGLLEGTLTRPPRVPWHVRPSKRAWAELVRLKARRVKPPKA